MDPPPTWHGGPERDLSVTLIVVERWRAEVRVRLITAAVVGAVIDEVPELAY